MHRITFWYTKIRRKNPYLRPMHAFGAARMVVSYYSEA